MIEKDKMFIENKYCFIITILLIDINQIASQNVENKGLVIDNSNTFQNSDAFDGSNLNFLLFS